MTIFPPELVLCQDLIDIEGLNTSDRPSSHRFVPEPPISFRALPHIEYSNQGPF